MAKRILALLLATVMVLGLFAGCSSTEPTPTDPPETNGSDVSETTPPTEEKHDPVTLHYYVYGYSGQEDAEKVYAKANEMIQEIYPWITVVFHPTNSADVATHIALAQAAGDPIDVVGTYKLDFANEVSIGALMDVTDYLDQFPGLMSALPEWAYNYGVKNGRTYGFPNWQQCNAANPSLAVPKDVADKYGFDVDKVNELIQSKETWNSAVYAEIEAFMAAARADGRDDIVLIPGNTLLSVGPVTRGYEQVWGPLYRKWSDDTCQLINIWEIPEVKEYLAWINDMKAKGYVPADYFEGAKTTYKLQSGMAFTPFIFSDNAYVPNFPELRKTQWGLDLYFMQTQKSATEYYVPATNAAGMTAVGYNCKSPEDALRFIELLYTNEEIYNLLVYGFEGEHYTRNSDGTIHTLEYDNGQASSSSTYGMVKWAMGNSKMAWINQSFTAEFNEWAFDDLAENGIPSALIGFTFDNSKISAKTSQVEALITEYQQQLSQAGTADWEASYNEFLEKMDKAGLDTIQQILQAQIDSFLANK